MICDSTNTATTFTTEACQSEVGEVPYVGKVKTDLLIIKRKHRALRKGSRKVSQKLFHIHYCRYGHSRIKHWDFAIFEQCETHA